MIDFFSSVNNLQPGQSTPKPITPELFGKLGHDSSSPFDIADHEEIHSFTKVCQDYYSNRKNLF